MVAALFARKYIHGAFMFPKVLHQTAADKDLSWEERIITHRNMRLCEVWDYNLWDNADILLAMRRTFPNFTDKFLAIRRGIVISGIGRYLMLYENGGIYVDTDYILMRIPALYMESDCVLPIEEGHIPDNESKYKLGNAVLRSKKMLLSGGTC